MGLLARREKIMKRTRQELEKRGVVVDNSVEAIILATATVAVTAKEPSSV